jgi:hypothetical protein
MTSVPFPIRAEQFVPHVIEPDRFVTEPGPFLTIVSLTFTFTFTTSLSAADAAASVSTRPAATEHATAEATPQKRCR